MKTVDPSLQTHLQQPVTTLATLWKIVRTDTIELFFTDHDKDITFEGNVYLAASGYSRTAIANSIGLSVDNMDVQGIFEGTQITEEAILAGLFDYADIYVALVNWADPSMGALKLRRGKFGEVISTPQGFYKTELRGMTQLLSQNMLTVYSPECRVDLGSSACQVEIDPAIVPRNTAVTLGQVFKVPTKNLTGVDWVDTVRNAGFDRDSAVLATTSITGWTVLNGNWNIFTSDQGLSPHAGARFLSGGATASGTIEQIIDLVELGVDPSEIDAGDVAADFSIQRANQSTVLDTGRVLVQFQNSEGTVVGTGLDTGFEAITPQDTWTERAFTGTTLPTGTRKIRIALAFIRLSGTEADTAFDSVSLTVHEIARTNIFYEIYENSFYGVTTAGTTAVTQPVYDPTPGNPTTDGTAVLTSVNPPFGAITRFGHIQDVIDDKTIVVSVTEPRDVDGWFSGGGLVLESSSNAGKTLEMKSWTQATKVLTVFLAAPFPFQSGTKLYLYGGCDKRIATCITKFNNAINFQGEPFVPGSDVLNSFATTR